MKSKIIAKDKKHLKRIIEEQIKINGNSCNLNFIDTSQVTCMSDLFENSNFNGDISLWNTSKVKNMSFMFKKSQFNGDISLWNTSNVKDMSFMFYKSIFNGEIINWNVEKVEHMYYMFSEAQFDNDLNNWQPYSLKDSQNIFFDNEKPYWADISENVLIRKSIDNYIGKKALKEKLEHKLSEKNTNTRKNKI